MSACVDSSECETMCQHRQIFIDITRINDTVCAFSGNAEY